MGNISKVFSAGLIVALIFLMMACASSSNDPMKETTPLAILDVTTEIISQEPIASQTLLISLTQQVLLSTAYVERTQVAIEKTKEVSAQRTIEAEEVVMATQMAEFPKSSCGADEQGRGPSPDENWAIIYCSGKYDQGLFLLNKNGVERILTFEDFLPLSMQRQGMPGIVRIMFWDVEGDYVYFTTDIGWSGGGDDCFPGFGTTGLFRLDLATGAVSTLIEPPEYFPGNKIKFSPTGRRYAAGINGVMITDLKTGEVVQLNADDVMDLIWSPDGTKLAFSESTCDEEGHVISSSIYIWDALTNQTRKALEGEEMILLPEIWVDSSILKIEGTQPKLNYLHKIYEYDAIKNELISSSTATPNS